MTEVERVEEVEGVEEERRDWLGFVTSEGLGMEGEEGGGILD